MKMNKSTEFWSQKIVEYCGEHHLSMMAFSRLTGLHHNTVLDIVNQNTKEISPMTYGVLWNTIVKNQ